MDRQIIAFSHIPKTGGQTLVYLLRKNYGAGHVIARKRIRLTVYRKQDLEFDLALNPWLKSMSGHPVKPFEHFGELDARLVWFTMLRDPVKRFISHYQHQFDRGKEAHRVDFDRWMKSFHRNNWMVRMMAGADDLEAAKQIMRERIRCVGFMEKYNESLLLMRSRLGLTGFDVKYGKPKNVAQKKVVQKVVGDRLDQFRDAILEHNELDIQLYDWALETLWQDQVREYGPDLLARDLASEFGHEQLSLGARVRLAANFAHRNLYYKPIVRFDRARVAKTDAFLATYPMPENPTV